MDLKLKDKVVMITGSTGGVGESLVRAFAAEGCKLAISSTKQEKLDKLVPTLDIAPDHLLTFVVDVSKEDQIKDMVEKTVEHFGSLDVQVNNAGYEGKSIPVDEQTVDNMMAVYNINVFGPGPIDTPMMTKLEKQALGENVSKEEAMKIFAAAYPDKRYAKPEEVANLALFLASDISSHITGSLVTMDGGQAALGR